MMEVKQFFDNDFFSPFLQSIWQLYSAVYKELYVDVKLICFIYFDLTHL